MGHSQRLSNQNHPQEWREKTMDTIINYVDSVFATVPESPELSAQKQAMLTKMQVKFQQL